MGKLQNLFLALISIVFLLPISAKPLEVNVFAKAALLMNAKTGKIIYEKNAKMPIYPASTTKMATVLYLLEKKQDMFDKWIKASTEALMPIDPNEKHSSGYIYPPYWLETDGYNLGIRRGEVLPFKTLIYAMMLPSYNDASNVLAEAAGGTITLFMKELNKYLVSIGCTKTSFNNPHGLHHPEHVTCAYDMAIIAKKALENPLFKDIVKSTSYISPKTNYSKKRVFNQVNKLLREGKHYYPYAIGIKTGTDFRVKNIVAAAEKDGRTLIACVFGGNDANLRYIDAKKLFDAAFSEDIISKTLIGKDVNFSAKIEGARRILHARLKEDLVIDYYPSEEPQIKANLHWTNISLPIAEGQKVGEIKVFDGDYEIKSVPVFAQESISKTLVFMIQEFFKKIF